MRSWSGLPRQPEVVVLTAMELARALGAKLVRLRRSGRVVERELPDGHVRHVDLNPDLSDERLARAGRTLAAVGKALAGHDLDWGSVTLRDDRTVP